jgi:hypothetical protein
MDNVQNCDSYINMSTLQTYIHELFFHILNVSPQVKNKNTPFVMYGDKRHSYC